jgi:hypothetical protein
MELFSIPMAVAVLEHGIGMMIHQSEKSMTQWANKSLQAFEQSGRLRKEFGSVV